MVTGSKAVRSSSRGTLRTLYGLTGFSATNAYQTANPGGIAGVATGFWVAALFRVETQAVTSITRCLAARATPAPVGWDLVTQTTNASIAFRTTDGAGLLKASPSSGISAAQVGKVMLAVGVQDASSLRLYVNRVQSGSPVAITGYTPNPDRMYLGKRASTNPAGNLTIYGVCGGHAIPTLAEVQAQADAVKLAGDMVAIPGKTDSLWSVRQDQAGAAPAVLEDKVGAEDLAIVGSMLLVKTPAVWGW